MKGLTAVIAVLLLVSCGYHVGGKADLMPKGVQTIAIPAFTSMTTDYKFGDQLANAIGHEFIERTRFQVVRDPDHADAVLTGIISRVIRGTTLSDPTTSKTTAVQLVLIMSITLTQRSTGKVLFSRPSYVARENYEFATDPHQIFDESGPAAVRLSQNVAREIVGAVVDNF
jgi:outer membrane lipopolysaccharide assembly protein LptE/RlpB